MKFAITLLHLLLQRCRCDSIFQEQQAHPRQHRRIIILVNQFYVGRERNAAR